MKKAVVAVFLLSCLRKSLYSQEISEKERAIKNAEKTRIAIEKKELKKGQKIL